MAPTTPWTVLAEEPGYTIVRGEPVSGMDEVSGFLEELSSSQPVPGGGSVAAFEVAMGAALLAMVSNLTLGRKKYQAVSGQATGARDRAIALRDRAERLVEDDVAAFGSVAEAMALPRGTDDEKARRRARMQDALKGAVLPPLRTMEVAREVLDLADELVRFGNTSAASDVGTAVLSAVAGHGAARLNVEINLAAITDETWARDIRGRMDARSFSQGASEAVLRRVRVIIRGEET